MTFGAISTLLPYIISGVRIAERFVIGPKRGEDKRALATAFVIEEVKTLIESQRGLELDLAGASNHLEIILNTKEISGKIADVVDTVVALMNYFDGFSQPAKPVEKLN